jgi:hypothetical protein
MPNQAIDQIWKSKPGGFIAKPTHHMLGSNTWLLRTQEVKNIFSSRRDFRAPCLYRDQRGET